MRLNYKDLIESYYRNLNETLRNFKPGPDFLNTWVPDEDHTISILGIFECAEECGQPEVSLEIDETLKGEFNLDRLNKLLNKKGNITLSQSGNGVVLTFATNASSILSRVPDLYSEEINKASSQIKHEGRLNKNTEGTLTSTFNNITLSCVVNQDGNILNAGHSGGSGVERVLLDVFCKEIIGKPVQEAYEHGIDRVEFKLRSKDRAFPVPGILTAKNSPLNFDVLFKLISDIFAQAQSRALAKIVRNFYVDPVSASFQNMTLEEKIKKVSGEIRKHCPALNLQETISVVDFKPDARAVISYIQDPRKADVGRALIKLERLLRESIDPRIELVLESIEDLNKRKERMEKKNQGLAGKASTIEAKQPNLN